MQSGVGKLSCNKTALKRCTSTETLWNREAPSLSSPEDEEIFLPKLPKSWHADVFKGFNCDWSEEVLTANVGIPFLLAGSGKLLLLLPRDAMHPPYYPWPCVCPSVRLSVCPSVTSRCSTETAKRRITQTTPHDTPGTLVF